MVTELGDAILDLLKPRSAHGQMVKPLTKLKFNLVCQFRAKENTPQNKCISTPGGKKSGTESKITLYTKQVEFIVSASFPRRLGNFMREKVTGKILIVKSRITYLITIQYCLEGIHFPSDYFINLNCTLF